MLEVIVILALLFVAFVALGVYVSVKAVGAAKRGVDRTISQARRTVEDTTLRARSLGQVGVAGELAQLRLRLRTSMKATQDALHAGVAEDASLKESIGLFQRLSAHGHELDDQLRRLEREPDRNRVTRQLPELRERVKQITDSADALRWAARDRAQAFAAEDLAALSAQIDVEAGALRDWSRTEPDWSVVDLADTAAEPRASAPDPGAARQEPADHRGADGGEQPPQALTGRDPRQQPYSWQKSPRPEATN
ncbi:hypothetical protein [Streptomyces sp. NPDC127084]|uniref:hypothetical protein n=1 Tax=Streptomyces sp. NPDC127084 TaxID=3347133 RepID=UPI00364B84D9